jgi:hypothetical protein
MVGNVIIKRKQNIHHLLVKINTICTKYEHRVGQQNAIIQDNQSTKRTDKNYLGISKYYLLISIALKGLILKH